MNAPNGVSAAAARSSGARWRALGTLVFMAAWSASASAEPMMRVEIVPLADRVMGVEATSRGSAYGVGAYAMAGDTAYLAAPCPDETHGWCVDETLPTVEEIMSKTPSTEGGRPTPLPDGRKVRSASGASAHYILPTETYAHGVLGDAIEAKGLSMYMPITEGVGFGSTAILGEDWVFEDITPRMADLDGDGYFEVITIMTDPDEGASLAIYGPVLLGAASDDTPPEPAGYMERPLARTPPIGQPNRWLNPAAIHDFDGDGVLDVALVETPHIGGELQLWSGASLLAGAPEMLAARRGYSNHVIGSRELDMAAVVRLGGEDALVLPNAARDALVAVAYRNGEWVEVADVSLPALAATDIAPVGRDLAVGLEDGTLARVVVTE